MYLIFLCFHLSMQNLLKHSLHRLMTPYLWGYMSNRMMKSL